MDEKVIILDLDGSLYNCSHRNHLAEAKQWDEFHSLLMGDTINPHIHRIIDSCVNNNDDMIVVITGRSERWRKLTWEKFAADGIDHLIDSVLMRPDDNYQKAPDLKMGIIERLVAESKLEIEDIAFAIEDREDIIERYIAKNIPVIGVPK